MQKFGFIGTGNMGSALATSARKVIPAENIYLSNRTSEKLNVLASTLGANVSTNDEISEICDFIYLGIKPQKIPEVCPTLGEIVKKRAKKPVIITMAAGTPISTIKEYFGEVPVIRIMPNTPVSIGKGVILYATENVSEEAEEAFLSVSRPSAVVIKLPESDIDAGSTVSGCGPAFVFMFLDAMAKSVEKLGLDRDLSLSLSANTILGAAELFNKSGKAPEELIRAVCSPGGSTIEGVKKFNELDLYGTCEKSIKASFDRTKELSKNK